MDIQVTTIFSFSNATVLACVLVALACGAFLLKPVSTIVMIVFSSAPIRVLNRVLSNVVVPAFSRTIAACLLFSWNIVNRFALFANLFQKWLVRAGASLVGFSYAANNFSKPICKVNG